MSSVGITFSTDETASSEDPAWEAPLVGTSQPSAAFSAAIGSAYMVAIEGASDIRRESALDVCPFARFSKKRPSVIKVMSMLLVSKIVLGRLWGRASTETIMAATLKKNAADVPITPSTSIVGEPCFIDFHAD